MICNNTIEQTCYQTYITYINNLLSDSKLFIAMKTVKIKLFKH